MGWRLAEEVAHARPARPGLEWWTLLDIAQDANDDTRQGWPGEDYLLERAGCSRATLYRRLKKLEDDGLLIVAERPTRGRAGRPGRRAVYEIAVLHELPAGAAIVAASEEREVVITAEGAAVSERSRPPIVSQSEPIVSQSAETPPVNTPVTLPGESLINGSVEGEPPDVAAAFRPEFDLRTRAGTDAARAYWADRLHEAESARLANALRSGMAGPEGDAGCGDRRLRGVQRLGSRSRGEVAASRARRERAERVPA